MPSSPVLAPVTRHPHDDCLHLSRLTRIYIFLSFISSLGTFILEVVWGTLSLWNMALPLTRSRLGRLVLPLLPSLQPRRPMLLAPSFSEEPPLILSKALWVPCLSRLHWHGLPAYNSPSSRRLLALIPPHTHLRLRVIHLSGRSSYKLVWGLVVEYGPAPDTLPARPIVVADASHPAISLAARRVQPHLSQRSRCLSYAMPVSTMPSSPVLAPVTRHPHDDCLHLSRLTRIYIFLSFISSLGTFILEVVWGTLSLWNMALPLTRSRLGRLVLPLLPSLQPRRPMLLAPSFSEEPPLILLSKALWVPCLSRLHWHGLPAYNSPSSRRLPVLIPPHTHLRLRVIHHSGRSSYKLVWGLVVEYGPA